LLLAAVLSQPSFASADLDSRIADLIVRLEEKREAHHVPGMSIVVVHDGRVILARGFGVTNLETGDPVTDDTLFMIGSTTKAFTSTLVAMMVDAGKMGWDEPIATYLPYFDPQVDGKEPQARVTVRDALSHRSGFSRMSVFLTAQGVSPKEVLEVAANAEPFDGFRKRFHYNNIMYLASGTASATVAGTDWHKLLQKKIFKPLRMKSSSSIWGKTKGTLHPGYVWDEDLAKHDAQPILPIDVAAVLEDVATLPLA
jgi:CubicO group peptidase (beta-lactamase class C family)